MTGDTYTDKNNNLQFLGLPATFYQLKNVGKIQYKIIYLKGSREEPEMPHLQNCDIAGSSKVRSGHLRFFHGIDFHQWHPQVD